MLAAALLAALTGAILFLLPAALLLTTLLVGRIALLLLAGVLIGILILIHSISFQRWTLFTRTSQCASVNPVPDGRAQTWEFFLVLEPTTTEGRIMGRYLLLWLLGIPLPILLPNLDIRRIALPRITKWLR